MANNEDYIRVLAHQIWESEGRPEGQEERHWRLATRLASEAENRQPQKRSVDPSEAQGPTEPEQPDQT